MNIVFLDTGTVNWNDDLDLSELKKLGPCTFHHRTPPEEISPRLEGAEVVITNKAVITREMLERFTRIRFIQTASTGTNHVDLSAAKDLKVPVANVVGYSTPCVSHWVLACILSFATRIHEYSRLSHQGTWCESPFYTLVGPQIFELFGKTLGIVGYGHIGKAVGELAKGIGMKVIVSARPGHGAGEGRTPFELVLARSDFLTLHTPLTPETKGLIGAEQLGKMKKGSYLFNAARGGIVDESALGEYLRNGHLGGAALDVLEKEPPEKGHPLLGAPNLILTPHVAWASWEARQRLVDEMVLGIRAFQSGTIRNRVA